MVVQIIKAQTDNTGQIVGKSKLIVKFLDGPLS